MGSALVSYYCGLTRTQALKREFATYCPELATAEARIMLLGILQAGGEVYATREKNVWLIKQVNMWRVLVMLERSPEDYRHHLGSISKTVDLEPVEASLCRKVCRLYPRHATHPDIQRLLNALEREQLDTSSDKGRMVQLLLMFRGHQELKEDQELIDYLVQERLTEVELPAGVDTAFHQALPGMVAADLICARVVEQRIRELLNPLHKVGSVGCFVNGERTTACSWHVQVSFRQPLNMRSRIVSIGELPQLVEETDSLRDSPVTVDMFEFWLEDQAPDGTIYLLEWEGSCRQPNGVMLGNRKITALDHSMVTLDEELMGSTEYGVVWLTEEYRGHDRRSVEAHQNKVLIFAPGK